MVLIGPMNKVLAQGVLEGTEKSLPMKVDVDNNLFVRLAVIASGVIVDLATHTFDVSGAGVTFDPQWVDIEGYKFWALWVTNNTGPNNIVRGEGELAKGLGGAEQVVRAIGGPIPAAVDPDNFVTNMSFGTFTFDFNNSQTRLWSSFKSIRAGYSLNNPAPSQSITVRYVGVLE